MIRSIITPNNIILIFASKEIIIKSKEYSNRHNIPAKDAIHTILAKENHAILVTRDKHFLNLDNDLIVKKP